MNPSQRNIRNSTLTLLTALLLASGHAAELHVAPNGSGANPGTKAKPFAPLDHGVSNGGMKVPAEVAVASSSAAPAKKTAVAYNPTVGQPVRADRLKQILGGAKRVTQAAARQGPPANRKWKMVWNDEFEGTSLNRQRWDFYNSTWWAWPGVNVRYAETNCALDGKGHLAVRLTRDADGTVRFSRGVLSREFEKAFGYFETRVQFSTQPAWWTAVWLCGGPSNYGHDPFRNPQEIDIFEDYYKPKVANDISHNYHVSSHLGIPKDIGGPRMIERTAMSKHHSGGVVVMEEYTGWHTVAVEWTPLELIFYVDGQETLRQTYRTVPVTTVPQGILISGCFPTPPKKTKAEGGEFHLGWLEDVQFPDQLLVDYIRVYDEDVGGKVAPSVAVTLDTSAGEVRLGRPVAFKVHTDDKDGVVKNVYLFSKGHIRAETPANAASVDQSFAVSNLFFGENTIIAMAKDNDGLIGLSKPLRVTVLTGREYTGTAYQGRPQEIPGRIVAGHYDEGGNGVAFLSYRSGGDQAWRTNEIGYGTETTIPVANGDVAWITYRVRVKEAGAYVVEPLISRGRWTASPRRTDADEPIQLEIDRVEVAEWKIPPQWNSGSDDRNALKPVGGKQRIQLAAGEHQLLVRFEGGTTPFTPGTYFGGFEFVKEK